MSSKILTLIVILGILSLSLSEPAANDSTPAKTKSRNSHHLLWGHYRPHRLSIVTQRSPSPLSAGFMFSDKIPAFTGFYGFDTYFRDSLSQNKRHLAAEYIYNDGKRFSQQMIADDHLQSTYNITFVKDIPEKSSEQSWVYLIEPMLPERVPNFPSISTFAYLSGETFDGEGWIYFDLIEKAHNDYTFRAIDYATNTLRGYFNVEIISGRMLPSFLPKEEGNEEEKEKDPTETKSNICKAQNFWKIEPPKATQCKKPQLEVSICYMDVPPADAWKQGEYIYFHMKNDEKKEEMIFDENKCGGGNEKISNVIVFRVRGPYKYKIKISYHSEFPPGPISVEGIQKAVSQLAQRYLKKLDGIFPIERLPAPELATTFAKVRRTGISNILGGLCYSYGHILTKADMYRETPTQKSFELFSSTPSRLTFPRGFLWDEGFHLLILCRWDRVLCMEILESWFNTMSETGWIPREQARGEEQESAFHEKKFLYQNEREANPPTLLLAIEHLMLSTDKSNPKYDTVVEFLNSGIEEKIVRWFEFFNTTQRNFEIDNNPLFRGPLFRWTCVEPCEDGNVMGSGLDDYPRADAHQEPLANLDLQVWMIFMVRTINQIARYKEEEPNPIFVELESKMIVALEEFKDPHDNLYKDILQDALRTSHGEHIKMYNTHFGYINLFPMFFGLIPPGSDEWKMTMGLMLAPETLWSDYGIRSLSATDSYFLRGDRYWTEPVWMNINYLILRSMLKYYKEEDDVMDIYEAIKENLLRVVTMNWSQSYTFWENYSSLTGAGQRSPSFYGWTTLIVLIMSDMY